MFFNRIIERLRSDSGFGLIEIVISMFMLAALAVAFVPVLIQGLRQSAANTTLATATQLVNERMQLAQSAGTTCSVVSGLGITEDFTDPRGVVIRVTTTVGTCPAGAGTVAVAASAVRLDTGAEIAAADTLVFVQ
jgi:type II secretory pathway pseudopilin PulG